MKIIIIDANIFIDVCELYIAEIFFELGFEIHSPMCVFNELSNTQKEVFSKFKLINKLILHSITEQDRKAIFNRNYPNSLCDNDTALLFLALKIDGILLSSDSVVRNIAKEKSIEYHGILWIFDKLVENNLISHNEASVKLKNWHNKNKINLSNSKLLSQVDQRIKSWEKILQ